MITPEQFSYAGRIQNFLLLKGLSAEQFIENFPLVASQPEKISGADSVKILRDIEEKFPFPIGFIGPIEATFQWSTMILTSYPEISEDILAPIFEEIEEKVEDEYFLMGPTFSVADCVLASDLQQIGKNFPLPPLIQMYTERVARSLSS